MSLFVTVVTSDLAKILLLASLSARGVRRVDSVSGGGILLVSFFPLCHLLLLFPSLLGRLRLFGAGGGGLRFLRPKLWFLGFRVPRGALYLGVIGGAGALKTAVIRLTGVGRRS